MAKATRVRAVLLENRNSKPALRSPEEKWKAETPRLNCIACIKNTLAREEVTEKSTPDLENWI